MTDPCPNAETLAAYGDGKLTPAERREVERHLAACEDCFELFAGAAAFRLEEAGASPLAALPPIPRVPRQWWLRAAAAAAVVTVGVWVLVVRTPAPSTGAQVLALADGLGGADEMRAAAAHSWGGGGGGLGFGGELPVDKRAFRLGVHLLDARVALAAGDGEHWNASLDQVAMLVLQEKEMPRLVDTLRSSDGALDGRTAKREDLAKLAKLARDIRPNAFDFGAWAEAGRMAALGGRTKFLESEVADRLDAVDRTAGEDPVVGREIKAIRRALGDHRVSTAELGALERSFEQLILVH